MDIVVGDLLTIEEKKYIVISSIVYEGKKYFFTNLIKENEELTGEYFIFTGNLSAMEMVIDDKVRSILLPKFEMAIKTDIEKIQNELES